MRFAALLALVTVGCVDYADKELSRGASVLAVTVSAESAIWNDYGACAVNAACRHRAENVQAVLDRSCEGLTAVDELGAFDWVCDGSAFVARFAAGRGLRDLVSTSGFLPNRVVVRDGERVVGQSAPEVWWSSPVTALPASVGTGAVSLATPNTIYVADTSRSSDGYSIDADGIALVTLGDAVITFSGAPGENCNATTGESIAATDRCLVTAGTQRFLWVEARLDARSNARTTLLLRGVDHIHINATTIRGAVVGGLAMSGNYNVVTHLDSAQTQFPLALTDSTNNDFRDITATRCSNTGIQVIDSDDNRFSGLHVADCGLLGVYLYGADRNIVSDVTISNIHESVADADDAVGLNLRNANANIMTRVLVSHTDGPGIRINSSSNENTLSHATIFASSNSSFVSLSSSRLTLVQIAAVRADDSSFIFFNAENADTKIADCAAGTSEHAFYLDAAERFRFSGSLWVGGQTGSTCFVNGGTRPGLIHQTCTDSGADGSSTYSGQDSTAVLNTGRDLDTSFVGQQTATASHDVIDNWTTFENPHRVWGRSDTANRSCNSGQTCTLWDLRLTSSDTQARDVNGAFGATCPPSANGNATITDALGNVFLRNALELPTAPQGDNDGLCETGETCTYSPNIGTYQGEGDLLPPCTFTNGTVTGITLHGYSANGG